jgi:hypothetical protein
MNLTLCQQEAEEAIVALNGKEKWGWNIKVNRATGTSGKLAERRRLFVSGLPAFPEYALFRAIFIP